MAQVAQHKTAQGKAFAPEYQGALGSLSVNSSLTDVLARGIEELRAAQEAGEQRDMARCGLAVAEAYRRLGNIEEADRAWKASYRAARTAGDLGAMAWALWSGGTLARQRGSLPLAYRLLALAAEQGKQSGDVVVRGYSLAGLAETGRIQGDYKAVGELHEQLLAEARRRGEARHTVWALEGIAQMHRNTGSYDTALTLFEEAAETAGAADDRRGRAWALRGIADVVSVRDGDVERALVLLTEAELACREMKLSSALAYNRKMRGNVLYRAGRYAEAGENYTQALAEFRAMDEPRGTALSRLGLAKALARLGRAPAETAAELTVLRQDLERIGLRHARDMVAKAAAELGVAPLLGEDLPERGRAASRNGDDLHKAGQDLRETAEGLRETAEGLREAGEGPHTAGDTWIPVPGRNRVTAPGEAPVPGRNRMTPPGDTPVPTAGQEPLTAVRAGAPR